MKTMLDIALETVNSKVAETYDFEYIFDKVEEQLKSKWENDLVNQDYSYEKIRVKKISELYRLLTVDGRFIHNNDGSWSPSYK